MSNNVTYQAATNTTFILVYAPEKNGVKIETFSPQLFKSFTLVKERWATLGSGSQFIRDAIDRDKNLGVYSEPKKLVDIIITGENYLDVANKSLTVDSQFTIGILRSSKAYILGAPTIGVKFGHPAVITAWNEIALRYKEILARAQQIRGEIREAQRALSSIQVSKFDNARISVIRDSSKSIEENRDKLQDEIELYFDWYDNLIGR